MWRGLGGYVEGARWLPVVKYSCGWFIVVVVMVQGCRVWLWLWSMAVEGCGCGWGA